MLKNKIIVFLSLISIVSYSFCSEEREYLYGDYPFDGGEPKLYVKRTIRPTKYQLAKENFAKEHPKAMALFDAIQNNDIKAFNELLPQVGDINTKDWLERTFLIKAAERGNIKMIQILLEQPNIKIDEQDHTGETALMRVVMESSLNKEDVIKIIKLLLSSGANPDVPDRSGNTFFTYTKRSNVAKKAYDEYIKSVKQINEQA